MYIVHISKLKNQVLSRMCCPLTLGPEKILNKKALPNYTLNPRFPKPAQKNISEILLRPSGDPTLTEDTGPQSIHVDKEGSQTPF